MARNPEMAHFEIVGEPQRTAWFDYQRQWLALREASLAWIEELGVKNARFHQGGLVGIDLHPRQGVPPGFSKNENGGGYHYLLSKGATAAARESVERIKARNKEMQRMWPNPLKLGRAHGFITDLSYKTERGRGGGGIGGFEPIQPVWTDIGRTIYLWAPDAAKAIARLRENDPSVVSVEPETWAVPEGYRQMTDAEFEFAWASDMLAKEREQKAA